MGTYDLVVRGGTIVDGTGVPRHRADLAVKDGRVAMISGRIPAGGAREMDADGCIVAPGAIDLHTHYDVQLNWDPYASLSGWFGVTSLTIGQCGFGFAPTKPEDRELNMRMMNRIEAIPLESMRKGIRWDWETFPEFLDSLDRQGLGVNVGALFPFSPLRGYVLGMVPARERTSVTDGELNKMKRLFYEGMKVGAFGFSADKNLEDRTEDGSYLPSHVASTREFLGLAEVLGEFGVGHIGWTSDSSTPFTTEEKDMLEQMVRISGRPLSAFYGPDSDTWQESLRAQGLPLMRQFLSQPIKSQFTLAEYNLFDYMPNWVKALVGSRDDQIAKLRDPDVRAGMKKDAVDYPYVRTDWRRIRVLEVVHERNYKYEGLTIDEVGKLENKHPLDAMLDLAIDEDMRTLFSHALEEAPCPEGIKHPYTHISVSDGGAHTRFATISIWPIHFLAYWVRDQEVMSLEQAHYKMSALPAWLAGFKARGTLRVGDWADIIVYDQEKLGLLYEKPVYANDFPGEERRLIQKPTGLRYIVVNGTGTFEENECAGPLPGKLLRSYDMVG
ncbi:MAG: amidohydrolase family protein [Dehalococcoidia bacterium]